MVPDNENYFMLNKKQTNKQNKQNKTNGRTNIKANKQTNKHHLQNTVTDCQRYKNVERFSNWNNSVNKFITIKKETYKLLLLFTYL